MTVALPSEHAETASVSSLPKGQMKQFISFKIGREDYAIDIMAVREIRGWSQTTVLPNQSPHVCGVINLRGTIVPVSDLRSRFGMGVTVPSGSHAVIIVAVLDRLIGLLVDAVSDILTIDVGEIRAIPETDAGVSVDFLAGIVSVKDGMIVILSLDKLFAQTDAPSALT
jgi:purine-binding chemotaxis protein CheW